MQLPKRRRRPCPTPLFAQESSQAELWTSLSPEQRRTCQELLRQLLEHVLHHENQPEQRSACHERQTSS